VRKTFIVAGLGLAVIAAATLTVVRWNQGRFPWNTRPQAVPPGPVMAATASFEFAVYMLSPRSEDPSTALDGLLGGEFKVFTRVSASPDGRNGPQVHARLVEDVVQVYPPPSVEMIER